MRWLGEPLTRETGSEAGTKRVERLRWKPLQARVNRFAFQGEDTEDALLKPPRRSVAGLFSDGVLAPISPFPMFHFRGSECLETHSGLPLSSAGALNQVVECAGVTAVAHGQLCPLWRQQGNDRGGGFGHAISIPRRRPAGKGGLARPRPGPTPDSLAPKEHLPGRLGSFWLCRLGT